MAKNADNRRQAAREKARQIAEAQAKREKRAKTILYSGIAIVVVAVIAVASVLIYQSSRPVAGPAAYINGGITVAKTGDNTNLVAAPDADPAQVPQDVPAYNTADLSADRVPNVEVYLDFQCPICQAFEDTNASALDKLVNQGDITVTYHPVSILDAASGGNKYSTRSANAVACVVDSGQGETVKDLITSLFANQPAEGAGGMDDEGLFKIFSDAGVDLNANIAPVEGKDPQTVQSCMEEQNFAKFIDRSTQDALDSGMSGTPWIKIDGEEVPYETWSNQQAFGQLLLEKTGQIKAN